MTFIYDTITRLLFYRRDTFTLSNMVTQSSFDETVIHSHFYRRSTLQR